MLARSFLSQAGAEVVTIIKLHVNFKIYPHALLLLWSHA